MRSAPRYCTRLGCNLPNCGAMTVRHEAFGGVRAGTVPPYDKRPDGLHVVLSSSLLHAHPPPTELISTEAHGVMKRKRSNKRAARTRASL